MRTKGIALGAGLIGLMLTSPILAGPPKDPPSKCAPDAVLAGPACIDRYEASVWLVPPLDGAGKSNKGLIKNIRKGKATLADLTAGNATQLGCTTGAFGHTAYPAGFPFSGNWTPDPNQPLPPSPGVYAASIPGIKPSACATWFQAEQACALSGKRLVTNQEWQRAAAGTPDPGTDNSTSDCNVSSGIPVLTGARTSCVSVWGAHDMVGNVWEWVADWADQTSSCTDWTTQTGLAGDDRSCFGGDGSTLYGRIPAALVRGGQGMMGTQAGVFAIQADDNAMGASTSIGFRCAR